MNLKDVTEVGTYTIKDIDTDDDDLRSFLFTLGCYSGEPITVISRKKGGCTVSIKDGRYNIDDMISGAVIVEDVNAG